MKFSDSERQRSLPRFLHAVPSRPHDPLSIPPHSIADWVLIVIPKRKLVFIRIPIVLDRNVRNIGNDRALRSAGPQELSIALEHRRRRRRRPIVRAFQSLGARPRDKLRRVLVARLQLVDELAPAFLPLLPRFVFGSLEFGRTLLAILAVCFFLLPEVLCVLFVALCVELDEVRIFDFELGYAGFRRGDVYLIDQMEG